MNNVIRGIERLSINPVKRKATTINNTNHKRQKLFKPVQYRHCHQNPSAINRLRRITGKTIYQINIHGGEPPLSIPGSGQDSMYFILVYNYDGSWGNHTIAAISRGDTLYVFDPNGSTRSFITDVISKRMAKILGLKDRIYSGPNLQGSEHVCVGFSSNFLQEFGDDRSLPSNKMVYRTLVKDPESMANKFKFFNLGFRRKKQT